MFDTLRSRFSFFKKESENENKEDVKGFLPKVFGFLSFLTVIAVFWVYPLLTTNLVVRGGGFEKFIFFYLAVLVIVATWLLKGVLVGKIIIKRTPLDLPLLFFGVILLISTLAGVSPKDSWLGSYGSTAKGLVGILSLFVFYYFLSNNLTVRKIKIILFTFLSSLSLMSIFSLAQFFGHFVLPWNFTKNQFFNTAGSLSNLASIIIISLPFMVLLAVQANRVWTGKARFLAYFFNFIFGLGVLAAMADLIALRNFVFWPVLLLGASISVIFFMSRLLPYTMAEIVLPLVVFGVAVIFVVTGTDNIAKMSVSKKIKLLNFSLPMEINLSRDTSWNISKSALKVSPFLGEGPATFYHSFSKYKSADFNTTTLWDLNFERAGSYLIEALTNWGILGMLAALIVFLTSITLIFLSLIKTENESLKPVLLGSLSSIITAVALAAVYPMDGTVFLFVGLLAILGVSAAILAYPEEFNVFNLSFRSSPKYALSLSVLFLAASSVVIFLAVMGTRAYVADIYARKSVETGDVQAKVANLQKAVDLFPYQDAYYLDLSKNLVMISVNEAVQNKDKKKSADALAQAMSYSKRVLAMNPNRVVNVEADAFLWETVSPYVEGAFNNAEKSHKRASELDPQNPLPYVRLAVIETNRSQQPGLSEAEQRDHLGNAIKYYEEANKRKANLAEVHRGEAMIYEMLADFDNAIREMRTSIDYRGNDLNYIYDLGRIYFNKGAAKAISATSATTTAKGNVLGEKESVPADNKDKADGVKVEENEDAIASGNGKWEANEDLMAAEAIFRDIYSVDKNHLDTLYSLALLYKQTGNNTSAKKYLEEFLAINPNQEQNEEIRKQFSDL